MYATVGIADAVLRLDARSGEVLDRIPLDPRPGESDEPHGLAFSPDGRHWFASVAHGEPTLWKFERDGDRPVGRVRLGGAGAARIGIDPEGLHAIVADYDRARPGTNGEVVAVALQGLEIEARRRVCPGPHQAEFAPVGRSVAVACSLGDEIVVLDGPTLGERTRFFVDPRPGEAGAPRFKPLNLAWSPEGSVLYVGLHLSDRVRAFSLDGTRLAEAETGRAPAQLAVSRDGRTIVVANRGDGSLSVFDAGPAAGRPEDMRLEERWRVALGADHPHGVALDAEGATAFVTAEGTPSVPGAVVAVDVRAGRVLWRTPVAGLPLGVAWAGDGPAGP